MPNFTPDEQYLIDAVKSPGASSGASAYMWAYILGGGLVAAFAAYHQSILMLGAALVAVVGFRLYEERVQAKWLPLWRSIIAKYEDACLAAKSEQAAEQT